MRKNGTVQRMKMAAKGLKKGTSKEGGGETKEGVWGEPISHDAKNN